MQKDKVTAATLEALIHSVVVANRAKPNLGDHLFKKITERIELARACTVDKPTN